MQRENLKLLVDSFREWIVRVAKVSNFGGVLVNKQLLPLKMDGKGVWCVICDWVGGVLSECMLCICINQANKVVFATPPPPPPQVHHDVLTLSSHLPRHLLGELVNCWLSVGTGSLIPKPNVRTSYCLLKPSDFERHRITVLLDSFARVGLRHHNVRRHPYNTRDGVDSKQDEGSEDRSIQLVDMRLLNQFPLKTLRENFG